MRSSTKMGTAIVSYAVPEAIVVRSRSTSNCSHKKIRKKMFKNVSKWVNQ
jgi:hypothetical protein